MMERPMDDALAAKESVKDSKAGEFPPAPVEADGKDKYIEQRPEAQQTRDLLPAPINETDHWGIGKLNKFLGIAREVQVREELQDQFPAGEGYSIQSEQYLRNADGAIVKDPETGEARRVDLMVCKDDQVIKSIEVTSDTAPKDLQTAKEARIREAGGNFILDRENAVLMPIPDDVITEIWRRT